MIIVLNVLAPDLDDATPPQISEREAPKQAPDRSRMTRLQVISITGEIVDVDH